MNREWKKFKIVNLPLYPFTIFVGILSEEGNSLLREKEDGVCIRNELNIIVALKSDAQIPTLCHECFHAVEFIMDGIGQKLGECPNESWSYLLGYLVKESIELL